MDVDLSVVPEGTPTRNCGDCAAVPGAFHSPGCDVERCPRCGNQMIGCNCIYEVNGIDTFTMEETHPEIYTGGPTDAMYAKWDAEWGEKRVRWTGVWPGKMECRALGLFCRDLWRDTGEPVLKYDFEEQKRRGIIFHVKCEADDPGAHEDLNEWSRLGSPGVP